MIKFRFSATLLKICAFLLDKVTFLVVSALFNLILYHVHYPLKLFKSFHLAFNICFLAVIDK